MEPQEGADMQPIILDDPNTKDPADFWLHPCAALAAIAGPESSPSLLFVLSMCEL